MDYTYTIVILKNVDTESEQLSYTQIMTMRDSLTKLPETPENLKIKLAFADAIISAINQKDPL